MNVVRGIFTSLAVLTLVVGCGQGPQPKTESTAAHQPTITSWSDIDRKSIFVPPGVLYTLVNVGGAQAAEIAGVPQDASSTGGTGGVSIRVPATVETSASGSKIRVTVRAAATDQNAQLGVAYSTAEVGNSGWRQFSLTQTPADYSFEYNVAPMREGRGDFIGFRSYGDARVQVLGYRVDVVGPGAAPAAAPTTP